MKTHPVILLVVAIVIAVVSWSASWCVSSIVRSGLFNADASDLTQLGANIDQVMEEHFKNTGAYPVALSDLSSDLIHAHGGSQSDLDHANYVIEGSVAIVVLARSEGPCVLLVFNNGKSSGVRFLNAHAN